MSKCGQVDFRLLKLVESKRPVANVRPGVVPIAPIAGPPQQRLRPLRMRRVRRHPPGPSATPADGGEVPPLEDEGNRSSDSSSHEAEAEQADDDIFDLELQGLLQELADVDLGAALIAAGGDSSEPPEGAPNVDAQGGSAVVVPGSSSDVVAAVAAAPKAAQPPPPIAPPRARGHAAMVLQVPGGSVAYYASKQAFEAVCDNPAHGRCVVTRTARGRGVTAAGGPKGGRPIGFLCAWLARGQELARKEDHWQPAVFETPQEERAHWRSMAARLESGRSLLDQERPAVEGEPAEPATLEGYYS